MRVDVFNAKKGDSFLLTGSDDCCFNMLPLIVDCGPVGAKVFNKLNPITNYNILLTHSHNDHTGGFPEIIKKCNISQIFIPSYLPEVIKIKEYLDKKLRKKTLYDWSKISSKIIPISENDYICNHIRVFNPPKDPQNCFKEYFNDNLNIENILVSLNEIGLDLPIDEIVSYESPILNDGNRQSEEFVNYQNNAKLFVHSFFLSLGERLYRLNRRLYRLNKNTINSYVDKHITLVSNHVSIVFQYKNCKGDWLFTGDADIDAFDRIIDKGHRINSKYLKVPHHGSEYNLTKRIFDKINPDFVIVSAGEKLISPSSDNHPNEKVLDIFATKSCLTMWCTNKVVKKKSPDISKTSGKVLNDPMIYFH